ncbi:hypothetical protein [Dactylosporangium sp. NPDC005555]|uniref:hypothetical protein n=1 Tax=Dactylosporangium sp. NPDC005555 TaxID=3154889 RepID=UPI0033BC282D
MDRDHLVRLLDRDGEAFAACRDAVLLGADVRVWDEDTQVSALVEIYAWRLRLIQRRGTPEVGFAEAVQALRACSDEFVRIGAVDVQHPPYHFQLFSQRVCDQSDRLPRRGSKLEDVDMRKSRPPKRIFVRAIMASGHAAMRALARPFTRGVGLRRFASPLGEPTRRRGCRRHTDS